MNTEIGDRVSAFYLGDYYVQGTVKDITTICSKVFFIIIKLDDNINNPVFKQDRDIIIKPQEIINY